MPGSIAAWRPVGGKVICGPHSVSSVGCHLRLGPARKKHKRDQLVSTHDHQEVHEIITHLTMGGRVVQATVGSL